MPRFKQTPEILRLMQKKENIRNVAIVAHVDHGKTTLTDSLLAKAGLLSPEVAGQALVLDYLEEEQKRGITIKTANISLLHEAKGNSYVINLVDTPGHVDFTGKVTSALRAVDGVLVVVDAVEEVMAQTETVARQALEERVKPLLFINKADRLITDLRLGSEEIQKKFTSIIDDFNNLVELYGEPEIKNKWKVDPEKDTVAFGSALDKWGFTLSIAQQKGIRFSDILDAYTSSRHQNLAKLLPVSDAILNMIVKNTPNPVEAQRYRLPRIWKGKIDSEIGRAMMNCDDDGPTMMCVTTVQIDPKIGAIVTGRLFSGSVTTEDEVYLVDAEKEYRIQQVSIYMGAFREVVDKVTAGNIVALSGLDLARVGETLIDARHKGNVVPFEQMKYVSEPVMSIVAEPRNPRDMQKLIDAIERLSIEDPNLTVILDEETGQYLLSGMGELHLEVVTKFLAEYAGQVELATTAPMVAYRESISDQGKVVMTKSSNKKNSFRVQTEPLTQEMTELTRKDEPVNEKLARKMALEKDTLWASDRNRNILVDATENVQNLDEAKESIISGFYWACKAGPLCGEPLRGVKVKLIDAQIHKDPTQREPTQISRAVSRAILGALLTARPVLLEPIYKIEISVPIQWLGICSNILARRRGKISSTEQNDSLMVITGFIPVAETFGLSAEMRSATSGCAFWQNTFSQWRKIPDDIAIEIIRQLRTKKGLPAEIPKPSKFVDEA